MNGRGRRRAAVCTLRVEPQSDYVLITITINRQLDRHLYSARPDDVQQFGRVRDAVEAVIDFLEPFDPTDQNNGTAGELES